MTMIIHYSPLHYLLLIDHHGSRITHSYPLLLSYTVTKLLSGLSLLSLLSIHPELLRDYDLVLTCINHRVP